MSYIKKYFLPFIIITLTFVLLCLFRSVPVTQLWKGFSVLYVPSDTEPQIVLQTLKENGCEGTISYYNQGIPYINEFLPIKADRNDSYLSGRNSYFFDRDHNVMIYYIPNEFSGNATKAVSSLINDYKIDAGLDCKSSFPLITPVICIIVALIFFFFSRNRFVFGLSAIFPLFYSFSMPFYVNAAAVCILFYGFYLCQNVWNRKGSIKYLLSNPIIIFTFSLAILATFFTSWLSLFMFILTLCSSFFILVVYKSLEDFKASRTRFNPILIRPAHCMKVINIHSVKKFFISIAAVSVLTLFYFTSVDIFSISNAQDLSFPMPTSYNEQSDIPVIDDYVYWTWNEITKPYKSVYSDNSSFPEKGETVSVKRFIDSKDGIKTKEEVLFCFDDNFKNEVIESIDGLDYPAVEKLMKAQGTDFSVNYSYGSGEKFSFISLMLMIGMILLPAVMATLYLSGIRKNGAI